jgi:hypothetical protein
VSCGHEVLAAILRPGNAGANNAADHLEVFELALEQPPPVALEGPILARSDSAGDSHALAEACRETRVRFSFGHAIDERVRSAILALPERAWRPAINADGQPREVLDAGALDHISPLQIRGEIPVARPSTPRQHAGAQVGRTASSAQLSRSRQSSPSRDPERAPQPRTRLASTPLGRQPPRATATASRRGCCTKLRPVGLRPCRDGAELHRV